MGNALVWALEVFPLDLYEAVSADKGQQAEQRERLGVRRVEEKLVKLVGRRARRVEPDRISRAFSKLFSFCVCHERHRQAVRLNNTSCGER